MPVRHDLVPLPVVKSWAKRLTKAFPDVSPNLSLPLSSSQEALARMLGHTNWYELVKSYEQPLSDTSTSLTNDDPTNPLDALRHMVHQMLEKKVDAFYVTRDKDKSFIQTRTGKTIEHFLTLPPEKTDEMMRAFYNSYGAKNDICFEPSRIQKTLASETLHGNEYQLFCKSAPRLPFGYRVVVDIFSDAIPDGAREGSNSQNILELSRIQKGLVLVCASGEAQKRGALNALTLALSRQKKTALLSRTKYPQFKTEKNVDDIVVPFNVYADFEVPNIPMFFDGTDPSPVEAVLLDFAQNGIFDQVKDILRSIKNGPVFLFMDAADIYDALVQIDSAGHLKDFLRYDLLSAFAQVHPDFGMEHDPVQSVRMLSSDKRDAILTSNPHEWSKILGA